MIDLGVATSIAKENNFSWQDTVDFALEHKLNTIQFYVTQNSILPQISNASNIKNIYLHLPIDYDLKINELILFAKDYRKLYKSNKLIIHQKESLSSQQTHEIISKYYHVGFLVGIENEGNEDLRSFQKLIQYLSKNKSKFFVVPDIHRFYFNYQINYSENEIYNEICKIFNLCKVFGSRIVLHVIDSISYKSNRNDWVSMFKGIIPYSNLLNYISEKRIDIESIIFEYESYNPVIKSLDNLKKIDYY